MRRNFVLGLAVSLILVSSLTASSLVVGTAAAAEDVVSIRLLAKASGSNLLILVKNSSKSTASVYDFILDFTGGQPLRTISRSGWSGDTSGDTVTFSTDSRPINPGARMIFLLKVSNAEQSAFHWSVVSDDGEELRDGDVSKVRVRAKRTTPPSPPSPVTGPEVNVNQVRVKGGDTIVVTGRGFAIADSVEIFLDTQDQLTTSITNADGEFTATVIIPVTTIPGGHTILAKDQLGNSSVIRIEIEGVGGGTGGAPAQLILTVRTDKAVYERGDFIKITGTAILESPVSLQVTDPHGDIICGANPPVNNATMTWESFCTLPQDTRKGTYVVQAKQLGHKTAARFTVEVGVGEGGAGEPGDNPGTLKISTDKESYVTGEVVAIRVEGARPEGIVQLVVVGPSGPPLEAKLLRADTEGILVYEYPLVASDAGTYKVSATQDKFVVRANFEVVEE